MALSKGGLGQYVYCTGLLSCNRTQSTVVTSVLTKHNTLTGHLYLMGLIDSPLFSMCGAVEETKVHILCECDALATDRPIWVPFSWTLRTLEV